MRGSSVENRPVLVAPPFFEVLRMKGWTCAIPTAAPTKPAAPATCASGQIVQTVSVLTEFKLWGQVRFSFPTDVNDPSVPVW